MLNYAKKAREAYDACDVKTEAAKAEFLKDVIKGAIDAAREEMIVPKATKALIELSMEENANHPHPILKSAILQRVDAPRYNRPGKSGLWPWFKKNDNADVVDDNGKSVKIKDEFYQEMIKTVYPKVKDY